MQFIKEHYTSKTVDAELLHELFVGSKLEQYYDNHMSGYFRRFGHDKSKLVKTNKYGKGASKLLHAMSPTDIWCACLVVRHAINTLNYVISNDEKDFVQSIEKHLDLNSHLVETQKHRIVQLALDAMLTL